MFPLKEKDRLDFLLNTGNQNGLQNLQLLNTNEIKEIEPYVEGLSAILVPETGIIDYKQVAQKLAYLIKSIT